MWYLLWHLAAKCTNFFHNFMSIEQKWLTSYFTEWTAMSSGKKGLQVESLLVCLAVSTHTVNAFSEISQDLTFPGLQLQPFAPRASAFFPVGWIISIYFLSSFPQCISPSPSHPIPPPSYSEVRSCAVLKARCVMYGWQGSADPPQPGGWVGEWRRRR